VIWDDPIRRCGYLYFLRWKYSGIKVPGAAYSRKSGSVLVGLRQQHGYYLAKHADYHFLNATIGEEGLVHIIFAPTTSTSGTSGLWEMLWQFVYWKLEDTSEEFCEIPSWGTLGKQLLSPKLEDDWV